MFSFFSLPRDVVVNEIFPRLPLGDLLNASEVCKNFHEDALDNKGLMYRIENEFGVQVEGSQCLVKLKAWYFFKEGLKYLVGDTLRTNYAVKKLAQHYFSKTHLALRQLVTIHAKDQLWVDYMYGIMFLSGYGVEKNIPEGIKRLEASANGGYSPSMMMLANMGLQFNSLLSRFKSLFIVIDYEKFTETVRLYCAFNLPANIPTYVTIDQGKTWLSEALKRNHPEAAFFKAIFLWHGMERLGIDKNKQEAIQLLSNHNNPNCLFLLATLSGLAFKEDAEKRLPPNVLLQKFMALAALFKRAADHGSDDAAKTICDFYRLGDDFLTPELNQQFMDKRQSLAWQIKSAELGDQHEAEKVAHYTDPYNSDFLDSALPKDTHTAIKFYELGSRFKIANRTNILVAETCLRGLINIFYLSPEHGIDIDLKKVLPYIKKGAMIGNIECLLRLGYLYLTGNEEFNIKKNEAMADYYFGRIFLCIGLEKHRSSISVIINFINDNPTYDVDRETIHRYLVKWIFRAMKIGNLKGRDHLLRNKFIRPSMWNNESFLAFMKFLMAIEENILKNPVSSVSSKDLVTMAEMYHSAFRLPYTPDPFLLIELITEEAIESACLTPDETESVSSGLQRSGGPGK